MKCKDKADTRGKDGCGRVFAYQKYNLVHSYTLECGYHMAKYIHPIVNLREKHPDKEFHHT